MYRYGFTSSIQCANPSSVSLSLSVVNFQRVTSM